MAAASLTPAASSPSGAGYCLADQRRMARARRYFAWQAGHVLPHLGRRVLEVGCGIGNFSVHLRSRQAVLAVDREPACLSAWRLRHGADGHMRCAPADLADDSFLALAAWRADSCVCLNVLEHLADDRAALARLAAVVAPGGRIVLIVPAMPALFGPVDRALGHHRRYRRARLATLATAVGLRPRLLRYWNFAGLAAWWANARLLRRETQSPAQIAIFDRLFVPILARLEAWAPPPCGQSLLAVLDKPVA